MKTNLSLNGADLRLAVVGAITLTFSLAACAAGMLGAPPAGISTVIVLLGMGIALKVLWAYSSKSCSWPASRACLIGVRVRSAPEKALANNTGYQYCT